MAAAASLMGNLVKKKKKVHPCVFRYIQTRVEIVEVGIKLGM